jgi:hypothetical protein
MNFLLSSKMSAQAAYQQISSIADAHSMQAQNGYLLVILTNH